MPNQTFFNLPESKRNKIIEAGFAEFANNPFKSASIAQIIKNAGIPRGSFYQYFEDKKDIYIYLAGIIAEEKVNAFQPVLAKVSELPFFDFIEEVTKLGVKFAIENPIYQEFGVHMLQNTELLAELKEIHHSEADNMYVKLLAMGIARGEIRKDIDVPVVANMFLTMQTTLLENQIRTQGAKGYESVLESIRSMLNVFKYGVLENTAEK